MSVDIQYCRHSIVLGQNSVGTQWGGYKIVLVLSRVGYEIVLAVRSVCRGMIRLDRTTRNWTKRSRDWSTQNRRRCEWPCCTPTLLGQYHFGRPTLLLGQHYFWRDIVSEVNTTFWAMLPLVQHYFWANTTFRPTLLLGQHYFWSTLLWGQHCLGTNQWLTRKPAAVR